MNFGSLNNLNNLNMLGGGGVVETTPRSIPGLTSWYRAGTNTYMDGAVQFTASDKGILSIASNSTLQVIASGSFEVGFWVYFDAVSLAANTYIIGKYDTNNLREWAVFLSTTNRIYCIVSTDGTAGTTVTAQGTTAISANTWYFVRAWYDRSKLYVSVNNQATPDSRNFTSDVYAGTAKFGVGGLFASGIGALFMGGRVDSAYWTKTVSSTAEATALYNAGAGRMYSDLTSDNGLGTFATNLISWWGFNEENGIRYDSKGTNHLSQDFTELVTNGTFTGASTGWTEGAGWAYGTNNEVATTSTADLSQATTAAVAGHEYKVSYTISAITGGTVAFTFGGVTGTTRSTAATFVEYITATNTNALAIHPVSSLSGTFDDISVLTTEIPANSGIAAGQAIDGNLGVALNGTSHYLAKTSTASLQTGNIDFTAWGWVNMDNKLLPINQWFFSKYSTSAAREWGVLYYQSLDRFSMWVSPDGSATGIGVVNDDTIGSPLVNNWYFIVAWHDSVNDKLWIQTNNGTAVSADYSGGATALAADFRIGAISPTAGYFQGRIDGVGFIKRVLTTAERTALFNSGKGVKYANLPSTIIADRSTYSLSFWNLDEYSAGTSDVTRADSGPNANDLTSSGNTPSGQGVNYYEGTVSKIIPIVGSENLTQTTHSAKLLYSTNQQNGHPALVGDALTKRLNSTTDFIGTGNVTVFLVMKPRTLGGSSAGRIIDNTKFIVHLIAPNKIRVYSEGSTSGDSANNSITLNTPYVIIITRTSAGITNIYINGTLSGTADQSTGTPVAGSAIAFLNNTTGTRGFDGSVLEVGHYNDILTATQIASLNRALKTYYAI